MNIVTIENEFKHKDFNYFIIDTDVGGDDAQTLILAFHLAKKHNKTFLGIACVDGNALLNDVVTNTLIVQAVADVKIPVYSGNY